MTNIARHRIYSLLKTILFLGLVAFSFRHAQAFIRPNTPTILRYNPTPNLLATAAAPTGPPAVAVPILLYHGVVAQPDGENTSRPTFIRQMEILKRAGYATITLAQLQSFYRGAFVLPPKPIMITFDDGRKDSFYPTDDIFRQLGFTATLFVASGPTIAGDSFYLTWPEMATVRDTGRWEIAAHGRWSHKHIVINGSGTVGRFLSSRIYDPTTGLETVGEFEQRVEQDYFDGIADLRDNLGIATDAFAVPFNDYGQQPTSNYQEATAYNQNLIQKYFHAAFIESLTYSTNQLSDYNNPKYHWQLYNYQNDNPLASRRLEPKEMDPELLKLLLERFAPKPPELTLSGNDPSAFRNAADVQYGAVNADIDGLHVRPSDEGTTARVTVGDTHWKDYSVDATITRASGRSAVLQVYAKDQNHAVTIGLSDHGVYLHELRGDTEVELRPAKLLGIRNAYPYRLQVTIDKQLLSASLDGQVIFQNVPITTDRGAVGIKIWDPLPLKAHAVIKSLYINQ